MNPIKLEACYNCINYKPMCNAVYTHNTGETHACFKNKNKWECKSKNDTCNEFKIKN